MKLTLDLIEEQKQEKNRILNERLDQIRELDDTMNSDNTFTESGVRIILLSAVFHRCSLFCVATKDYWAMYYLIRTFRRLNSIKQMYDTECFELLGEMK